MRRSIARLRFAVVSIVVALGLHLPARAAGAQPIAPVAPLLRDFQHEKWNTEDGLPNPTIQAAVRTKDGYLWLGTARGLVRFDGVRFASAELGAEPRFQTASVTALLEDEAGALWIGTVAHGLARVRPGAAVEWFGPAQGLPSAHVRALYRDRAGRLWSATNRGLASYERQVFVPVTGDPADVLSLGEDAAGTLWVGTTQGTFVVSQGAFVRKRAAAGGIDAFVWALQRDRSNRLWAGTNSGLFESSGPGEPFLQRRDFGPRWIGSLAAGRDGRLWIGTSGDGLHVLEASGARRRAGINEGLSQEVVSTLHIDGDDSVWIGTPDGMDRLHERLLRTLSPEGLARMSWSVTAGRNGGVWIGSNRGLAHASPDGRATAVFAEQLGSGVVRDALETRDGALWIGMDDRLVRVAPPVDVTRAVPRDVPPPAPGTKPRAAAGPATWGRVRALFEDRAGTLWIGATGAGLVRRDVNGALTPQAFAPGRDPAHIWTIAQDDGGALWVGGDGLHRFADGTWTTWRTDNGSGLPIDEIMAILPDGDDLWIGGYGEGLMLKRGGRFTVFRRINGAVLPQAYAIVDDGRGSLWVSSSYGLQRLAKRELLDAATGRRRTFTVTSFDKLDGLVSTEFNGAGEHAGARTAEGKLWFANASGAVLVDPARIGPPPTIAPVRLESVAADDRPLPLRGAIALARGQGRQRLEFQFSSPSLLAPRRLRFRYRLEGFDQDWVDAGLRRTATYTGLEGGRYRFRVQAYYAGGDPDSGPETGVAVVVPPFVTETRTFALSLVLGLVAAGYGVHLLRVRRLRKQADALTRIVDERTQALRAAQADLEQRVQERTAQLEAELNERHRLEHHLAQAQKLDSIGRLAGGIAHDLNNLLTAILGYASFAEHASVEDMREDVRQITAAGERAARLTQQLLAFARRQVTAPRQLNLTTVVRGVEPMLRRLIGEDIDLVCVLPADPWTVCADANQLEQVLVNLAINARDAMPDGGTLTIAASHATASPAGSDGASLPDCVVVAVTDTGIGMPDSVKAHLFEPFFTTKPAGKGTGLGLATSYGIVTQAGGRIEVESAEGRGTTVRVFLPRVEASPEIRGEDTAVRPRVEAAPRDSARTVLLTEDEPLVRAMAARVLRDLGHHVLEAMDGEDALEAAARHAGAIDLLVTDLVMPRLGGLDLATRLRALRPDVRVLFMSGYADRAVAARLPTGAPMLHKPFTPDVLARHVQEALEGNEATPVGEPRSDWI